MTAPLVDPRVAKHGGTRTNPKKAYDFPGMASEADWRKTRVHQHTRYYACVWCGVRFKSPHAVYTHLAKVHDIGAPGIGQTPAPARGHKARSVCVRAAR